MTRNQARERIYRAFVDNWNPSAPRVPFSFPNEDFNSSGLLEWVRVSMLHTEGGQWTLGRKENRVYRRRGAVFIEVYSPVDRGLLRLDELMQAARDIFEGENHEQVMFNDGQALELPVDGQWARGDVSVFFTYDETK